jgi:cytosine/adenosine deaminase-related metal-dependent hydrolase
MRALADCDQKISAQEILQMATVNGARALGLTKKIGELTAGANADLIAIPFSGRPGKIYETVLAHSGNVTASLIEGRWAIPPL